MDQINNIRIEIDKIDIEIMGLIKKRMDCVSKIGELKKKLGMDFFQPNRRNILLEHKKNLAIELGLDDKFIVEIWELIHKYSLKKQSDLTI